MRRLAPILLIGACSGEPNLDVPDQEVCLTGRNDRRYCIWKFEAQKKDATAASDGADDSEARSIAERVPWTDITWDAARNACMAKGLRLCERDEWIDACDGAAGEEVGTTYTYGDTLDATRCNVGGGGKTASGSMGNCKSSFEVFDLSGNVWEWTGNTLANARARGGGWRSSQTHRCSDGDTGTSIAEPSEETPEVGFRCCRDQ
jgi:formylglycine-generating enzyme required for sulfatase activity